MPAVKLSPLFNGQTVTSAGAPASGYYIYTYAAGSSSELATYTDSSGNTAQANPVTLNANGAPNNPIWLQSGLTYKLVLKDASFNVIRTIDNVSGINDTSGSTSQWQASSATPTYVSATSFTLVGDQTGEFHVGRRIQATVTAGTVYGRITSSAYTTLTTIVVSLDSGSLDSGLSAVNLSILRADLPALPNSVAARSALGATATGEAVFIAASAAAARSALGAAASTDIVYHGQCRLTKSGSNLLLSPHNGNKLVINGVQYAVPAAGVTLAPTSLSTNTTYNIYAYMNAGTMTLEASATAHATDATTGVEIKSGDATRTLVGIARTNGSTAWVDTVTQRFVRSWFNDLGVALTNTFTANRTSAATAGFGEVFSEIRCEFLLWSGESVSASASGNHYNSGATNTNYTGIGIDSTSVPENGASAAYAAAATGAIPVSVATAKSGLAEGYHYATLLGYVSAGTCTWAGGVSTGVALNVTLGG